MRLELEAFARRLKLLFEIGNSKQYPEPE